MAHITVHVLFYETRSACAALFCQLLSWDLTWLTNLVLYRWTHPRHSLSHLADWFPHVYMFSAWHVGYVISWISHSLPIPSSTSLCDTLLFFSPLVDVNISWLSGYMLPWLVLWKSASLQFTRKACFGILLSSLCTCPAYRIWYLMICISSISIIQSLSVSLSPISVFTQSEKSGLASRFDDHNSNWFCFYAIMAKCFLNKIANVSCKDQMSKQWKKKTQPVDSNRNENVFIWSMWAKIKE